ncbi:hypothetical protein LSCM1_02874 [Leishmania martiniquensis]|uniref:Uncharacterized protein n=1 Tax=Leishmania martiniquensis TaxID=1580590 RepID=A0A836KLS1_9TRYP|nr:hypothetical protein LSCM1_02874 [Leishmania martiniquensis]
MRRTAYYMGRSFTQRHLNACCSPLLTGFVRPNAFSSTAHALAASPLRSTDCIGGGSITSVSGAPAASSEAALSQLLTAINSQGKSLSVLVNLACIQNISTCVCVCVRLVTGMVRGNLRLPPRARLAMRG